ncbi:BTAD domain-containing putative transcriptional regulator [Glycomyces albus]
MTGGVDHVQRRDRGRRLRTPLGDLIRSRREQAGLTQRDLAQRSGLSLAAIRDLEQGRSRRPRRESVRRLALALDLPDQNRHRIPAPDTAPAPLPRPAPPRSAATALGVLGPLTVWRGGVAVPLTAEKQRSLLLRLALSPNEVVGREELKELVWGPSRPDSATQLLYTYVARLRRLLGPGLAIESAPGGYRLAAGPDRLDLVRFRDLAARAADETDPARAVEYYAEAARLWRGETDVDALRGGPLATALTEAYASLLRAYAAAARALGDCEPVLPRLRDLANRLELDEPLHAELVKTLAAAGRQTEALAAYGRIRAALADQLGIDPGEPLRDAQEGVLRQRWHPAPKPQRRKAVRQAPAAPPDFVGRERELAAVEDTLCRAESTARVVALSGPAGVGKTALALQAARRLREAFPDGQLYADLRGVSGDPVAPLEVLGRFLRALGVPAQQVGTDQTEAAALLRSELADRRMLLILDDARDARQVAPLLPGPSDCAVLVASRYRLPDLVGAEAVELGTMPVADALGLLAGIAGPQRITADSESGRRLAEACGGLPLALRIAGARLSSRPAWTTADLVDRLRDTDRRLAELNVGDLGVSASFELGYRDLGTEAQRAFRLCALHPGDDFGLESAAVLLDTAPAEADRLLGDLLDANMLLQFTADRFRFHDLLGLYANGLLEGGGAPERARLHAWYLRKTTAAMEWVYPQMLRRASCEDRESEFASSEAAMAWLDTEAPALVALIERTADAPGPAWRLADQLRGYFFIRRHVDRWLRTADAGLRAAIAEGDPAARAAMHISRGQAMWAMGRHEDAIGAYAEGAEAAETGAWRSAAAYVRHNIGLVLAEQGRLDEAEASYRLALELSADDEYGHVRTVTLNGLGVMYADQGRLDAAAEHFAAALRINRATGREASIPANLGNLGMVLLQLGDEDGAEAHLHEGLDAYRRLGNLVGELSILDELSQLHARRGRAAEAVSTAKQGYDLTLIGRNRRAQAALLATLGEAHSSGGDIEAAADAFEKALAIAEDFPFFKVRATIGLAGSRERGGDGEAARRLAGEALEAARAQGFRILEASALEVLARCGGGRELAAAAAAAYRAAGAEALAERVETDRGRPALEGDQSTMLP